MVMNFLGFLSKMVMNFFWSKMIMNFFWSKMFINEPKMFMNFSWWVRYAMGKNFHK